MSYLEIKNLTKVYGKKETETVALKDVNLSIEKGECIAVVGSSGSGKSTLLHMIGLVDTPTEGRICFDGEEIGGLKEKERAIFRRRTIGFVFQEYNLIPTLTVEENIEMAVRLDGRKMEPRELEELIQALGLDGHRKHMPNELSGGQKQRVAIGRALANHPSMILADEPTGNLDRRNSLEIMALLKKMAEKYAQTLLVVTHDENIAAMADRIITISDGEILSDVRVKETETERNQEGEEEWDIV